MIFSPRSREQKMVDHLYPFFGEIARTNNNDYVALHTAQRLIQSHGSALQDAAILPLLDIWSCECPEEESLTEEELHWALMSLENHIGKQLMQLATGGTQNPVPEHAKKRLRDKRLAARIKASNFRVIQGGKSEETGKLKPLAELLD